MLEIRLNSSAPKHEQEHEHLGQVVERRNGHKLHFCLSCDFPIAIYGRLEPCHHIFCFICARKNSTCSICQGKVARVNKFEMLEGIYICGAARCFKSLLEREEFEAHVKEAHKDLLSTSREGEEQVVQVVKPLERQSRQQQFRNAQQQRQQEQQQNKLKYYELSVLN